ncbi:T9SS type A sorting domain-containing protein [Flavobacterium sp.]|uniref:T9SS type A sorting domain-containing protein n=1 Tax=Flavobacterium sp. TaxID=239 RepID=UPI004048229A
MKKILTFCLFFVSLLGVSQIQQRIKFEYDTAGNQIKRYVCLCSAKVVSKDSLIEGVEDVKFEDFEKASREDVLSYYPNPVREELYLKWELINNNAVTKIAIYSLNGQLVKTFVDLENNNTQTIPFMDQPDGTYLVLLFYTNNEQKSITIVKQ